MDDIIKRLKEYSYQNNFSQVELAKELGVSFQTVNRWFNNKVKPSNLQLNKIQKLLKRSSGKLNAEFFDSTTKNPLPTRVFRFRDPFQKRIYDGLIQIGEESAAFFMDACQIMNQVKTEEGFKNPIPLVCHALREIDSSLRSVLRPLGSKPKVGDYEKTREILRENFNNMDEGKLNKIVSILHPENRKNEIKNILSALGINEEEQIAQKWLNFKLHKFAHRNSLSKPRIVDEEFINFWAEAQNLFDALLQRFKDNYNFYMHRIDVITSVDNPRSKEIKILRNEIPNNLVTQNYLFSKLKEKSSVWLGLLEKNYFFKCPPEPEYDPDKKLIYYSPWPASRYLAHISSLKAFDPIEIYQVVKGIPKTRNTRVHIDLIDCAINLSPKYAKEFVKEAEEWLSLPFQHFLPEKLATLIIHLSEGEEIDEAIQLTRILFEVKADSRKERKTKLRIPFDPKARFETWDYEDALNRVIPALVKKSGIKALECISDLFENALNIKSQSNKVKGHEDYSYMWCSTISSNIHRSRDILEILMVSVYKTVRELVSVDKDKLALITKNIEGRRWNAFQRIALFILAEFPDLAQELISGKLLDKKLFDAVWARNEYWPLAAKTLDILSPDQQNMIFKWIDDGPQYKTSDQGEKVWQKDRFGWISRWLKEPWKSKYESLSKEFGLPSSPEIFRIGTECVGPTSPKSKDDLKLMSPQDIISFLKLWRAPNTMRGDSMEGLGRILSTIVGDEPQKFSPILNDLKGLDPTYVRSVLDGLTKAVEGDRIFEWDKIIDLCKWVVEQPRQIPERKNAPGHLEFDPDWGWTRKQIARLFEVAFEKSSIPIKFRGSVWPILQVLTNDPDPAPDDASMEPATESINSVRGVAMHAIIRYALWIRRNFEQNEDTSKLNAGLEEMKEVKCILEEKLNPDIEKTLAIRSVYGQWLPWLVLLDIAWVTINLHNIFPKEKQLNPFRDAVWKTYIVYCHPYDNILDVIKNEYAAAIARIDDSEEFKKAGEGLSEHIMTYAYRGKVSIDDPQDLFALFFKKATFSLRKAAFEFLGRVLYNSEGEVPAKIKEQFKRIWENRVVFYKKEKQSSEIQELNGFGWWYASGKLDEPWALEQLILSLNMGALPDPEQFVIDRLEKSVSVYPLRVAQALILIINGSEDEWLITGSKEEIRKIAEVVYNSSDAITKKTGKDLINRLVAKGYLEVRSLLN